MRRVVGTDIGVKASGGVRTAEDAIKMAQAGANRLGASRVGRDRDRRAATARRKGY